MISLKLESVVRPRINTFFVSEEISVSSHLPENWSICKDFFLDTVDLCCKAKVDNFVEVVGLSTCILCQMVIWTFLSLTNQWEA